MTLNCNNFNWSTPDATTGKIIKLEKEVVRLEDEINQQGLAFKREEGTDTFIITKETIHSLNSTELQLYPIPDLSLVPPTGQIFAYTLPRSYVNTKNHVIGTVYTTVNENNTFNNPDITKVEAKYVVTYYTSDKPGIVISDFNPFDMYTLGELRIEWMPKPTTLTSPAKVVCDIIDAKNALQLYETPIPVFFRPVNYGEDSNYWWMTWGYKNDSSEFSKLLEGQPFRFTESSFGHNYTLYKNGGSWAGNNMCTAFPSKTSYHSWSKGSVFSLFVSNSEGMKTQLRALGIDPGSNTAYALRTYAKIYKSNGSLANVSNDWYTNSSQTISGYDKAMCVVDDKSVSNGETITCKIDINGNVSLLTSQAHTSQSGLVWFTPLVNCLDSISYYSVSSVAPQNELKLYMKKGEVFKFTDNNWDGTTNPFVYLNNVDGYNITPDPSSAATLTTPYSIVSNGVMLAENLESHTYKINDIGNDITAINNQISNINNQIFTLQHFQAYIEEKNSWYNVLEENMVSILGSCMLKFVLPIDLYSLRNVRSPGTLTPWQMSYQGIDSLPQLTFSANTTQPIKAITYSTDTTVDDESLPTTKWVNNKISSVSFDTDSPTFTGTTTVTNLTATSITTNTINGMPFAIAANQTKTPFIPVVKSDAVMEVGRIIDFHSYVAEGEISGTDHDCRLKYDNEKLQCTKTLTAPSIEATSITTNTINGYLTKDSLRNVTTESVIPVIRGGDGILEIRKCLDFHSLDYSSYCRLKYDNEKLQCAKTFTAPNISASFTVTHETGASEELTVGTFCETDGTIYEKYKDDIKPDDCICNIKQSKELNKNIIGVTISTDPIKFATHGDVLIKVVNDTYNVGDILVPGEGGYGKKPTGDELMTCLLNKIPTAKITSLETGIDNEVACML